MEVGTYKLCIFYILHTMDTMNAAEYKFDVTIFDTSPLVGASSSEEYRLYLPWDTRDATFSEIGRAINTGTGDVGIGYQHPGDEDDVPDGFGLPSGANIHISHVKEKWRRMGVRFPNSSSVNRVGVFYATTERRGDSLTIPIIKMSETAIITPSEYTKTIGVGEFVTFSVKSSLDKLRWVHNNGEIITAWNDMTEVTIDNVRLADAGIYECFEFGKREMGQHAIMRLIVRACPSPKYGLDCSNDCVTCWNGGVCAADNGVCLCQPGFSGNQCEQRLGSNYWGAQGSLYCSSKYSGNCRGVLICGPDPIGCACVAGYMGLDCTTACLPGWYGSNCNRECNCDISVCDPAIGCTNASLCRYNYCQGFDTCSTGFFGAQCEFVCHCHDGYGCDQQTGVCNNGKCAYGWGGTDCQQALPYYNNNEHITADASGASVRVEWNSWNKLIDFGTGPVDYYIIYYRNQNGSGTSTPLQTSFEPNILISALLPELMYNFTVSAVKLVGNEILEGPQSVSVTATTDSCGTLQTVENVQVSDNSIEWDEPSNVCTLQFEYHVEVSLISIDNCEKTTVLIANTTLTLNKMSLPNLNYFSTYRLTIQTRAVDRRNVKSVAYGQPYTTEFVTKGSVPSGAPQNVEPQASQNEQVSFTWDLPLCGHRHGYITGYEYEYWLDEKYIKNTSFNMADVSSSDQIRTFRVRALTTDGPGPYNDPLTVYVFRSDAMAVKGQMCTFHLLKGEISYITIISASVLVIVILLIIVIVLGLKRWREHNDEATPSTSGVNEAYQDLDIRTREKQHHYQGTVQMKPVNTIPDYQNTSNKVIGRTSKQQHDVRSDGTGPGYAAATDYEDIENNQPISDDTVYQEVDV